MKFADIRLRVGVAFAFLYPPINAAIDPNSWIGYFPPFARGIIDDILLLNLFGVVEVLLALWILSGWKIWLPSFAVAAMLLGIVAFNIPEFQVLFRDLSIAAMAISLAVINFHNESRNGIS